VPVYQYKATDSAFRPVRGTVAGDSPRQARDELRQQGLAVVELHPHFAKSSAGHRPSLRRFVPGRHNWPHFVASFTGDLATLTAVGVPLLESLDTLIRQHTGNEADALLVLREHVASGGSLADAMRQQPRIFDSLCTSMVEVGENTGNLDDVLGQLSRFKHRSLEFRDRVTSALIYPALVLGVSLLVVFFLMTVVVPMLLANLLEAGRSLPWPTQLLKTGSDLLITHGWWLAIVGAVSMALTAAFLRTERGRRAWYALLLKIPVFGDISRKQGISRVALVTGTLLNSGLDFVKSIEIAGATTHNVLLREALQRCRHAVSTGRELDQAMGDQSIFPPMVVQVFSVGQSSGRLAEMLLRLAEDFDTQVQTVSNRISAILEPVLIVGLSVFVGFILFATLLPILEAGNVLAP
jgi:type II secretory pathway component PulF